MHFPVVAVVYVCKRRGDTTFRHHSVCLAEQRFADEPNARSGICRFDSCAQSGATSANDENIVRV
jgi:hypothetical protein